MSKICAHVNYFVRQTHTFRHNNTHINKYTYFVLNYINTFMHIEYKNCANKCSIFPFCCVPFIVQQSKMKILRTEETKKKNSWILQVVWRHLLLSCALETFTLLFQKPSMNNKIWTHFNLFSNQFAHKTSATTITTTATTTINNKRQATIALGRQLPDIRQKRTCWKTLQMARPKCEQVKAKS